MVARLNSTRQRERERESERRASVGLLIAEQRRDREKYLFSFVNFKFDFQSLLLIVWPGIVVDFSLFDNSIGFSRETNQIKKKCRKIFC